MLPPLEGGLVARQNISSLGGRYQLTFDAAASGSVAASVQRATWNAESILECLSNEAWSTLSRLRSLFDRPRRQAALSGERQAALTRRTCEQVAELVAQFFGVAQTTMIADGGWRFCEIGQRIERAVITANALSSTARSLVRAAGPAREHAREIQLSAFLRMLGCRDVYRRVYQMRIEAGPVLQMLWQNPMVPRSVNRCLSHCLDLLVRSQPESSHGFQRTVAGIEALRDELLQADWDELAEQEIEKGGRIALSQSQLVTRIDHMLDRTLDIHHLISDGFLNHQIHMREADQPLLTGFQG
jgi:uncharacterized alpha-E superfamily protein